MTAMLLLGQKVWHRFFCDISIILYLLILLLLVDIFLRPWRADSPGGSSTVPRPSAPACSPPPPRSGCCHGARPVAASTDFVGPFDAPPSGSWSAPQARGACAQRALPAFADAEQAVLPPGGMLAWHQPQPGGTWPAVLERARIADRCHEGGRRSRPHPGNRHQSLTRGMRRGEGCERLLIIGELLLQA